MEEKNLMYLLIAIIVIAVIFSMFGLRGYGMMGNYGYTMMGSYSRGFFPFMFLIPILIILVLILIVILLFKKIGESK
jgi:uncharacterized membrane protein